LHVPLDAQEASMTSKFQLKTAKNGQFHFNLIAGNGEIILSSELYKAKVSALKGIASVKNNANREGAFEVKASSNDKH
jgi:uncharacterized protein